MQAMDTAKYKTLYLTTANDYVRMFHENLTAYVQKQSQQAAVQEMFLCIHSIKSQSQVMGYTTLGDFCKEVEVMLRTAKDNTLTLSEEQLEYLAKAEEKIRSELDMITKTGSDAPQDSAGSDGAVQSNGKRVLLVEDDTFFQQFYAYKLRQSGFAVDVAGNGEEGMKLLQEKKPDLVLLDLIMPVKDGFQVLTEKGQLADNSIKNIPVIVFSTLGQETDVERAKTLGAVDYINKSFFDYAGLLAKIHKLVA